MTTQQMLEVREQKRQQMLDLQKRAKNENRPMNADELQQWDGWHAEHEALTETYKRAKQMEKLDADAAESITDPYDGSETSTAPEAWQAKYARTLTKFALVGNGGLNAEERAIMANPKAEKRGTSTQSTTTTLGGYTIPAGFLPELEKKMLYFSDLPSVCRIIRTASGNNLSFPSLNDTGTKAILTSESAAMTVADATFGQISLDAYSYTSLMKFSEQLVEDSAFNIVEEMTICFAERFGRAMNESLTTGTGSSQPNGLVTASTLGKTCASTTVFTRSEIVSLTAALDRAYRGMPNVRMMMHDSTLTKIKQLEIGSADGRPLWQPSIRDGEPDKIEGYQYIVNNDMSSTYTTGQKLILFGDFSKYYIRMVNDIKIKTLNELYAATNEVGLAGFQRWDGELAQSAAMYHLKLG